MNTALVNINNMEIYYRPSPSSDLPVINQIFNLGAYDIKSWEHFKILKKYGENINNESKCLIIDAGANIGASSLFFSNAWEKSLVVAIEPERKNYALLNLNSIEKEIKPIEAAIGSESGFMYLSDPGHGDVGFRVDVDGEYKVKVLTINQIIKEYENYHPFIIKIDIEGGESELFSKNTEWVEKFPLIIIELHDWMLPLKMSSKNFQNVLFNKNFEILHKGENIFCFNIDLLKEIK